MAYIRPTSNVANGWGSPSSAYDGNTSTGATYAIGGNTWSPYLEMYFSSSITCDEVQVYDTTNSSVTVIEIDLYDGTTWTNIHNGTPQAGGWNIVNFTAVSGITGLRVRFYRPAGGGSRDCIINDTMVNSSAPIIEGSSTTSSGVGTGLSLNGEIDVFIDGTTTASGVGTGLSLNGEIDVYIEGTTTASGLGTSTATSEIDAVSEEVQRSVGNNTSWALLAYVTDATALQYIDQGPFTANETYYYRVRNVAAGVLGAWSNEASVTYVTTATVVEGSATGGGAGTGASTGLSVTLATAAGSGAGLSELIILVITEGTTTGVGAGIGTANPYNVVLDMPYGSGMGGAGANGVTVLVGSTTANGTGSYTISSTLVITLALATGSGSGTSTITAETTTFIEASATGSGLGIGGASSIEIINSGSASGSGVGTATGAGTPLTEQTCLGSGVGASTVSGARHPGTYLNLEVTAYDTVPYDYGHYNRGGPYRITTIEGNVSGSGTGTASSTAVCFIEETVQGSGLGTYTLTDEIYVFETSQSSGEGHSAVLYEIFAIASSTASGTGSGLAENVSSWGDDAGTTTASGVGTSLVTVGALTIESNAGGSGVGSGRIAIIVEATAHGSGWGYQRFWLGNYASGSGVGTVMAVPTRVYFKYAPRGSGIGSLSVLGIHVHVASAAGSGTSSGLAERTSEVIEGTAKGERNISVTAFNTIPYNYGHYNKTLLVESPPHGVGSVEPTVTEAYIGAPASGYGEGRGIVKVTIYGHGIGTGESTGESITIGASAGSGLGSSWTMWHDLFRGHGVGGTDSYAALLVKVMASSTSSGVGTGNSFDNWVSVPGTVHGNGVGLGEQLNAHVTTWASATAQGKSRGRVIPEEVWRAAVRGVAKSVKQILGLGKKESQITGGSSPAKTVTAQKKGEGQISGTVKKSTVEGRVKK